MQSSLASSVKTRESREQWSILWFWDWGRGLDRSFCLSKRKLDQAAPLIGWRKQEYRNQATSSASYYGKSHQRLLGLPPSSRSDDLIPGSWPIDCELPSHQVQENRSLAHLLLW